MHVLRLKYQTAGAVQLTVDQHIPGQGRAAAIVMLTEVHPQDQAAAQAQLIKAHGQELCLQQHPGLVPRIEVLHLLQGVQVQVTEVQVPAALTGAQVPDTEALAVQVFPEAPGVFRAAQDRAAVHPGPRVHQDPAAQAQGVVEDSF